MTTPFLVPENPRSAAHAWAVVLPVPFDRCAAGAPGARTAPAEILAASRQVETHDLEAGCDPTVRGLFTAELPELDYSTEDAALDPIGEAVASQLGAGRFVLLLGGESTVLAGSARGLARAGGIGVVRLEGVLGCEDERHGLRAVPRTAARRASELLPLRSSAWRLASGEALAFAHARDLAGPTARELVARSGPLVSSAGGGAPRRRGAAARGGNRSTAAVARLVAGLPDRVWLAVDLSVLDPAALPMPGNLEPGGLAYADLTALAASVFASRRVVGAEITGLYPRSGDVLPAFVAARLGLRILALACRREGGAAEAPGAGREVRTPDAEAAKDTKRRTGAEQGAAARRAKRRSRRPR